MTIRSRDPDAINNLIKRFQHDVESVISQVIHIMYFMRGAISYEECMRRTYGERQRLDDFIEKRLEVEKESPFPNY